MRSLLLGAAIFLAAQTFANDFEALSEKDRCHRIEHTLKRDDRSCHHHRKKIKPQNPRGPRGPRGHKGSKGDDGEDGERGRRGRRGRRGPAGNGTGTAGPAGPIGPVGPAGLAGPAGPAGPTGPAGPATATIIPFASGAVPLALTSVGLLPGDFGSVGLLGFGSAASDIAIVTPGIVTLDSALVPLANFAFSMPYDGIITSIAAFFSNTLATDLSLLGENSITVQVWTSTGPVDNDFLPTGVAVTLTLPGDLLNIGDVFSAAADGFSEPVTAGTRILLVFSVGDGDPILFTVTGQASAGLGIQQMLP